MLNLQERVGKSALVTLSAMLILSAITMILPELASGKTETIKNNDKKATDATVVVRVNGVDITDSEVERETNYLIPKTVMHRQVRKRTRERLREKAIKRLIEEELIYQEAKAVGVKLDKKDIKVVDSNIEVAKKKLKKMGTTLKEALEKEGHDIEWLRGYFARKVMIIKMKAQMREKLQKDAKSIVTDEFMREYYKKNMEKFVKPEAYKLREILIKVDPSSPQEKWNEAEKRAQEIIDRLKKGEDFAKLAKELSGDKYAKRGGYMGIVHRGGLMAELEHVVEKLKVGEIGGPIYSLYGFHIIKLEDKVPAVQKSYDEVRERLKKELKQREYKRLWDKWLQGLKDNAKIEYLEKRGKDKQRLDK